MRDIIVSGLLLPLRLYLKPTQFVPRFLHQYSQMGVSGSLGRPIAEFMLAATSASVLLSLVGTPFFTLFKGMPYPVALGPVFGMMIGVITNIYFYFQRKEDVRSVLVLGLALDIVFG